MTDIVERLYDAKRTIANAPITVSENNDLQAALDAAISRLQSLQWRPIEEAPKDGTRLLLMTPWGIVIGQWRDETPASDCARAMIYAGWESEGGETWPPHNMGDQGDTEQHGTPTHFIPLSALGGLGDG